MAGFSAWIWDAVLSKGARWGGDAASGSGNIIDQTDAPWHSPLGPLETMEGADSYETVAASQTDQALGATGATGDFLAELICVVSTAATGNVFIQDGADTAILVLPNSPGGGVGTYVIPINLRSRSGAWSITTGAGVAVIARGIFT